MARRRGSALPSSPRRPGEERLLDERKPRFSRRLTTLLVLSILALPFAFASPIQANDLPVVPVLPEDPPQPDPTEPEPIVEPEEEDGPEFFDEEVPSEAETIVYVVDRSSSMSLGSDPYIGLDGNVVQGGNRLDYVKTELKRSINSLAASFSFNVIVYDECVEQWRPERQRATAQNKAQAMAWIDGIEPWGWTNTGGAATLGLADAENDTILLLSDGAPNFLDCAQSYVADFETHKNLIRQANTHEATIHTFGIGLDPATRSFLEEVAQENHGTFREVD